MDLCSRASMVGIGDDGLFRRSIQPVCTQNTLLPQKGLGMGKIGKQLGLSSRTVCRDSSSPPP